MPLARAHTKVLTPLLSAWLLAAFAFAPAAHAQAPAEPQSTSLRLSDTDWAVPTQVELVQAAPAYEEPPAVPGGIGLPGNRASSDVLMVGLAAAAGAFVGGLAAGCLCGGIFLLYYY